MVPDDLYILYTGGTTGMPKGVLWRQHDIFVGAMGGRPFGQATEFESLEAIVEASKNGGGRSMPTPPLMHGAAQWTSFTSFTGGNTVVLQPTTPGSTRPTCWIGHRARAGEILQIVGDAFARPLIDELRRGSTTTCPSLIVVVNGGAPMNSALKERLLDELPNIMMLDARRFVRDRRPDEPPSTRRRRPPASSHPGREPCVVSEDLDRLLAPGDGPSAGWPRSGLVPLGYLGDAAKTARTFPAIDGVRYSVPGDRARLRADGIIELLGRDSVTINSGGEKIFAEEVERRSRHHPAVYDVRGRRPAERALGQEVVAHRAARRRRVRRPTRNCSTNARSTSPATSCPKAFIYVPELVRSPAGKADYRWAKEVASQR